MINSREETANNILKDFCEKNKDYNFIENVDTASLQVGDYIAIIRAAYDDIYPILTEINLILCAEKYAIINDVWCFEYGDLHNVARKVNDYDTMRNDS